MDWCVVVVAGSWGVYCVVFAEGFFGFGFFGVLWGLDFVWLDLLHIDLLGFLTVSERIVILLTIIPQISTVIFLINIIHLNNIIILNTTILRYDNIDVLLLLIYIIILYLYLLVAVLLFQIIIFKQILNFLSR